MFLEIAYINFSFPVFHGLRCFDNANDLYKAGLLSKGTKNLWGQLSYIDIADLAIKAVLMGITDQREQLPVTFLIKLQ